MTLAFRFIPFIAESSRWIQDSHALRNASDGQGRDGKERLSDIVSDGDRAALVVALKSIPHLAMSSSIGDSGAFGKRTSYRRLVARGGLFIPFAGFGYDSRQFFW
jgi:hypothetical protein